MSRRQRRGARHRRRHAVAAATAAGVALAACALRIGGPAPESFRVLVASSGIPPQAGETGEWLRALDAHVALIAAEADSAWFAATAVAAGLTLSGPALADSASSASRHGRRAALAFLAWEPLGDTTVAIVAGDGARILVHDALYRTDRGKALDLMAATVPAGADPREAARALLTYVATDVMHDAIVLLALGTPDAVVADSLETLLRPVLAGSAGCDDRLDLDAAVRPGALRLYFGPVVRVRCEAVRGFRSPLPTLLARLVLAG